jgi:hypothetical protein
MAKYHNPTTDAVVYTDQSLAKALNMALPANITPELLAPLGWYFIQGTSQPVIGPGQKAVRSDLPVHTNGVSAYQWTVTSLDSDDLADLRASTTIDRVDFAEALFDDGQLTEAELLEWATGQVPSSVDANLSAILSGAALAKARARVMSAQTVNRNNDIVLLLQAARQLTDAQVDSYFGIGT